MVKKYNNSNNSKVNRILVMFVEVFLKPFEQKENGECIKITDMVIFHTVVVLNYRGAKWGEMGILHGQIING
jgi:hypothetical protein